MSAMAGPHDWPEDVADDNGQYQHRCLQCAASFVGHKHRLVCHVCEDENKRRWDAMSEAEQDAARKRFAEIAAEVFGKPNKAICHHRQEGGREVSERIERIRDMAASIDDAIMRAYRLFQECEKYDAEISALRSDNDKLQAENHDFREEVALVTIDRDRLKGGIERLKDWIRQEGMRNDTCTYDVLHEICDGCQCKRQPQPNTQPQRRDASERPSGGTG